MLFVLTESGDLVNLVDARAIEVRSTSEPMMSEVMVISRPSGTENFQREWRLVRFNGDDHNTKAASYRKKLLAQLEERRLLIDPLYIQTGQ